MDKFDHSYEKERSYVRKGLEKREVFLETLSEIKQKVNNLAAGKILAFLKRDVSIIFKESLKENYKLLFKKASEAVISINVLYLVHF